MGREFEMKYSARPWQQAQILAVLQGQWQTFQMQTVYYDTRERDFSRRRCTLRLRRENGEGVCTVKTPQPGNARGEWECRCERIEDAIPLLLQAGCPAEVADLAAKGLEQVCGAEFTRRALTVNFRDTVLEVALDRGVLLGGGKELPLCEAEVELKSGSEEAALAFARDFAGEFGLKPEERSKVARALALAGEG